jgi:phosphotransferase system enzyme I (PtsI)
MSNTSDNVENTRDVSLKEIILDGYAISPGIGFGIAFLEELVETPAHTTIDPSMVYSEKQRFQYALNVVRKNVKTHIKEAHSEMDEELGQILKAHEMMLYDQDVLERVEKRIEEELKNVRWAVNAETERLVSQFEATRDPYLQARAEDVRDLATSILKVLSNDAPMEYPSAGTKEPHIMVTKNLYPSLAMRAHKKNAHGFVTESPAISSHAAIILKGLAIPVVGAIRELLYTVRDGDEIIVDGINGQVIVHPRRETKEKYKEIQQRLLNPPVAHNYRPLENITRDGTTITLMANIEHPYQTSLVFQNGLNGIGLFRTEFLAIEQNAIPAEEEQYDLYRGVIEAMGKHPVIIRTLDIGADKSTARLHGCSGMNPALGVRGLRRHLEQEPEELRMQLRAILRAAAGARVSIMFPMVTTVDDIIRARDHVTEVMAELEQSGLEFERDIRLGAMVEIPSAAIEVASIMEYVDFISVGTNDLLQYFTGADRNNTAVLSYYNPHNESFIWLLRYITAEAERIGRISDINICGELASDPDFIPTLLHAGYRILSISPVSTEKVRKRIASVSLQPVS